MQPSTLIPLLFLLATGTALARTAHPNAAGAHRRHLASRAEHARQVDRIVDAIDRREQVSAGKPRALAEKPKKMKKRGASGCRARTTSSSSASATATSSATSASSTSTDAATTTDSAITDAATSTSSSAAYTESSTSTAAAVTASTTADGVEAYVQAATGATTSSEIASSTSSSAAAATSTSSSSTTGTYTPNSIKAGIAGGDAYDDIESYIGAWYDWNAVPSGHSGTPLAINMLWGDGTVDSTDAARLAAFEAITSTPDYIIGFEEPDCSTEGSSNIAVATAAALWDSTIAPWKAKGSVLVSPSMCHQAAEQYTQWLASFSTQISTSWDVTNLHINKNSMDGVKEDLDYYWNTYQKPIWVTEFACVDDSTGFVPCTDQDEINTFINDIVALFESDSRVHAYFYSNGEGLGDVWPMWENNALSTSGQTYINAVKSYA